MLPDAASTLARRLGDHLPLCERRQRAERRHLAEPERAPEVLHIHRGLARHVAMGDVMAAEGGWMGGVRKGAPA